MGKNELVPNNLKLIQKLTQFSNNCLKKILKITTLALHGRQLNKYIDPWLVRGKIGENHCNASSGVGRGGGQSAELENQKVIEKKYKIKKK